MASSKNHIVNKFQFDITLQNENYFSEVSRKLMDVFYQELQQEIDRIFSSQRIPPEIIFTIDRIELDLGAFSKESLEKELKSKFIISLATAIEKAIKSDLTESRKMIHLSSRAIQLIRYFLRLGTLPWWSGDLGKSLDSVFRRLILTESKVVRSMIFEEAIHPIPRKRVINQFQDPTIYALFGIISAESSDYYKDYTDNLIEINQYSKITNADDFKFKKVIQDLTFIYLLDQKETSIDQLRFFKAQLFGLSKKYEIDYSDLVEKIFFTSEKVWGPERKANQPIYQLSKLLYREEFDYRRITVDKEEKVFKSQKFLEEFLNKGSSTLSVRSIGFSNRDELFQWLAKEIPKEFVLRYRKVGREWKVRDRTLSFFNEDSLEVLFQEAAPKKKPLVFEVFQIMETIHEEITPINQENIAFKKVIRHFALELLVFQDVNKMSDENYFKRQIQFFSKRFGISELEIIAIIEDSLQRLKKHKKGIKIIQGILKSSKKNLNEYKATLKKKSIEDIFEKRSNWSPQGQQFLSNVMNSIRQTYSSEIFNLLKEALIRYLKLSPIRDKEDQILLFLIKKLEKLSGDRKEQIVAYIISNAKTEGQRNLIEKAKSNESDQAISKPIINIEYLMALLDDSLLQEYIQKLDLSDPVAIIVELIFEKGDDFVKFLKDHSYDENVIKLLSSAIDIVVFRVFIKQVIPEESNRILDFYERIMMVQERWKIGRISKNQFEVFLREQLIEFVVFGGNKEVEFFILERMKQKGLINYKHLNVFKEHLDFSEELWRIQAVANLFLDTSTSVIPNIKTAQKIYIQDIILNYLAGGNIPDWVEKEVYDLRTLRVYFIAVIKNQNLQFANKLSEISGRHGFASRLIGLLEAENLLLFIKWISEVPGHSSINTLAKRTLSQLKNEGLQGIEYRVYEIFIKHKLWLVPDEKTIFSIVFKGLSGMGYPINPNLMEVNDWVLFFEFLNQDLNESEKQALSKIFKNIVQHPLKFFETLKRIPLAKYDISSIIEKLPPSDVIPWFKEILKEGNFPARVKEFGELTVNYLIKNRHSNYVGRVINSFLVHFLFPNKLTRNRIRHFYEDLNFLPLSLRKAIIGEFLTLPAEAGKKSAWWLLFNQAMVQENNYQLPAHLKQNWIFVEHYLRFGSIPYLGKTNIDFAQLRLILLELLGGASTFLRSNLHRLLKQSFIRKNLFNIIEKEDLPKILNLIHPDLNKDFNQLMLLIDKKLPKEKLFSILNWKNYRDQLETILKVWTIGPHFLKGTGMVLAPIVKIYAKNAKIEPNLLLGLLGTKGAKGFFNEINQVFKNDLKKQEQVKLGDHQNQELEAYEKEGIYIKNAGLVLLWPFIGRYFKRLNMVKDGDFVSEDMRVRGVQLTQFLVTGGAEMEESELSLNKLICGAGKDMVVEKYLEISEEEMALSESLLQGVIYNWEKMRGTRVDTFRQSFLQRAGVLRKMENFYELRVEEKTYDVLLTTLPWNLSMIKLAWMKDRITVVWK